MTDDQKLVRKHVTDADLPAGVQAVVWPSLTTLHVDGVEVIHLAPDQRIVCPEIAREDADRLLETVASNIRARRKPDDPS